ncbi:MFS transporter [Actinoplanes sp. NBRC 103695]|uniref:MFS transporter n=1 Tax=Actinoplanes sp. NBRC 103695 TaxID=3032202 RepID=UPI0024A0AFAC|nr:MFS transporter [Actinoplanes sp. NBRC 103695]GLY92977.1 MFS transporter [Actinoplanes sp. NBRC 103695]
MTKAIWRFAAPAVLMAAWGGNHFSPLLLLYRRVDGYSTVEVNLFFAFYILGLIPGFLVAGPLADRYGRRRTVAVALGLGVLGSVILMAGHASVLWMCAGRLVCGVSVAAAMVAGTTWIKELSEHDADPPTRARRASLTLTAGFGLGAGVSGALAQWGPAPTILPYAVQIALSAVAAVPLARALPTGPHPVGSSPIASPPGGLLPPGKQSRLDLRLPPGGWRRFAGVVLPMAPWVFGAPALAFVIGPSLVADRTGDLRIAFATLLAVLTLLTGAGVQPLVPRLARLLKGRQGVAGLGVFALATALLAVETGPLAVVGAALLFGIAYGVTIVSGLVEVQALASPRNLAALTGVYWSITYVGFAFPVVLAAIAGTGVSYPVLLAVLAALSLACAAVVLATLRRPPDLRDGHPDRQD